MAAIHVIGLGTDRFEALTAEVQQLLTSARHLVLRTGHSPVADELRSRGAAFTDLDSGVRVSGGKGIADTLRRLAVEHGDTVYAVPEASPLRDEATRLLCTDADLTVIIHPGRSVGTRAATEGYSFERLVAIMRRLRGPDGCLWDKEQTHASLARHLVEEAYEVVDAIERGDAAHLAEELGDLLLQVVFHAQIADDEDRFSIDDILEGIIAKLVRRHPHIFADTRVESSADVTVNWERIKREEKGRTSALGSVLPALPALMYAEKLQSKAAGVGFDWEEYGQVVEKVKEELAEVVWAKEEGEDVEAEIGDALFAVVNLARFLDVDCETALRGVCARFVERFNVMERLAGDDGLSFADLPLEEKEMLWQRAKQVVEASGDSREQEEGS